MTLFRRARSVISLKKSITTKTKKERFVSLDNPLLSIFTLIIFEFAALNFHIELLDVIQSNYCWYTADASIIDLVSTVAVQGVHRETRSSWRTYLGKLRF